MTYLWQSDQDLSRDAQRVDDAVRAAVRLAAGFAAAALVFLVTANVWMGTCTGSTADDLACGAASESFLTAGAPVILLIGAIAAARRGQRAHEQHLDGSSWLVASLSLAALTLLSAAFAWTSLTGS